MKHQWPQRKLYPFLQCLIHCHRQGSVRESRHNADTLLLPWQELHYCFQFSRFFATTFFVHRFLHRSSAEIIFMLYPTYMLTYISLSTSESLAFCLKASWQLLLSSADPSLLWCWKRQTPLPGRDSPSWEAARALAASVMLGAVAAKECLEIIGMDSCSKHRVCVPAQRATVLPQPK